jgi:hypothetical protein
VNETAADGSLRLEQWREKVYETGWRSGSPALGRLIADLESEFDLLRLERYVADLQHRDELLLKEIDALRRARVEAPSATTHEVPPERRSLMGRWRRALRIEGRIVWLRWRRGVLAEERRRCSAIAEDIRFGMRITGMRSPRE